MVSMRAMSITSMRRRRSIHWTHQGEFIGPFVYALDYKLDMEESTAQSIPGT